jgi:nitrate reductase NapE component
MREMEAEIRHEFLYGSLNHLGMDGLREFYNIRRSVREQRIKAIQDQKIRREKFIEMSLYGGLIVATIALFGVLVWSLIQLIVG